jgi:DNA primase
VLDRSEPKYVFPQGRKAAWPYGSERVSEHTKRVAIVEGALDAEAYLGLFGFPALGLPGVTTRMPEIWRRLVAGKEVVVAVDSDKAGTEAADRIMAECRVLGAAAVVRQVASSGDWTDLLRQRDLCRGQKIPQGAMDVVICRPGTEDHNDPHNLRFAGDIPGIYCDLVESAERVGIELEPRI